MGSEPPAGRAISIVLFDFGGVVSPAAGSEIVAEAESHLGLQPGTLQPALYEGDAWPLLSISAIEEDEYWRRLAAALRQDHAALRSACRTIWEPVELDGDVIDVVRALRSRFRVGLLSNATVRLQEHLDRLQVAELFDPIINSAVVGLRKPDPRVFLHALDVLGARPGDVLFIDDKERNTRVATELGIPSIVFTSAAHLREVLAESGLLPGTGSPCPTSGITSTPADR